MIHLWDWKSGHKFQKIHRTSVYESQEVPICVFSAAFDKSGSRLFVSDASNIIKVYGEAYTRVIFKIFLFIKIYSNQYKISFFLLLSGEECSQSNLY